ncbi:OmpL47-type beta-barrel domain-containing protein [Paenibacillus flagellatus]|nr:Ig-like domain-containing protein [Paenibacillus flagellatus]
MRIDKGKMYWAFGFVLVALCFLIPAVSAQAATYYIAPTGSDTTGDGSISSPWLTINKAQTYLAAGDTLYARGGTYHNQWGIAISNKAGTSTAPVTIAAYPGETPVFSDVRPSAVLHTFMEVRNSSWVVIDGLHIQNYSKNGFWIGNDTAVPGGKNHHITIRNCKIQNIGTSTSLHHGIYLSADNYDTTISNNIIDNVTAAGIHMFHTPGGSHFKIYNNILSNSREGIIVDEAHNNTEIFNNTFYNNTRNVDVSNYEGHPTLHVSIYNNVSYNSIPGQIGLWVWPGNVGNVIEDNNLWYDTTKSTPINWGGAPNGTPVYRSVADLRAATNNAEHSIQADPLFVNRGANPLQLQSGSPAIDTGTSAGAPSDDYLSNQRPVGAGYDLGAYEFSFRIDAVSKVLGIGEATELFSTSDLSGAQYTSDNPSIATVDSHGVVTAIAYGVANITATLPNDNPYGKSSTIPIRVAEHLISVTLQSSEPRPEVGQTQQYTVTGLMSDGSAAVLNHASIRYYMSGSTIASVSSTGLVSGISSGTDTLNADVTLDGLTIRTSTLVTIDPPTLASVALTISNDTLVKGQTAQLTVSAISNNGKPSSLKPATMTYHSSNPAVASVGASGLVTAIAPGTAAISVEITFNGVTHSATRTVTVQPGLFVLYPFTQLPILTKTAGTIIYAPTLQFEANDAGHSITFRLDVPETHLYQLELKTFKTTSYGNYAIKIDGQPFAEYNFYGTTGSGTAFDPIGALQLTSGVHQLTFENLGKNPQATNYKMGVIQLKLLALPDAIAPTSTAELQGAIHNGWYSSDVRVNLSATDGDTGVSRTEYRLDDASDWLAYTGPFTLSADGGHTLDYRSMDEAGNVEQTKTLLIHIDKTAPSLTLELDKTSIGPPNHKMVTVQARLHSNDAASGVESVILSSITSNEPDSGSGDVQANIGSADTTFGLRAERLGNGTGRLYTITYTATDKAGNQTLASATVTVPHDQSAPSR